MCGDVSSRRTRKTSDSSTYDIQARFLDEGLEQGLEPGL